MEYIFVSVSFQRCLLLLLVVVTWFWPRGVMAFWTFGHWKCYDDVLKAFSELKRIIMTTFGKSSTWNTKFTDDTQLAHVKTKANAFWNSWREIFCVFQLFTDKMGDRWKIKILKKNRLQTTIEPMFSFEENVYSANTAYAIRLNWTRSYTTKSESLNEKIRDLGWWFPKRNALLQMWVSACKNSIQITSSSSTLQSKISKMSWLLRIQIW